MCKSANSGHGEENSVYFKNPKLSYINSYSDFISQKKIYLEGKNRSSSERI